MKYLNPFQIVCFLLAAGIFSHAGLAGERVALVIGNGEYENVTVLDNPVNDAEAVTARLRVGGYEVIHVENGGVDKMALSLKKFARKAAKADVAVLFFAGHGFEVKGTNYLVPVDADLEIDPELKGEDAEIALEFALDRETIPLETVLEDLGKNSSGLKLIVLDCCRNNPFAKSRSWARKRSGSDGGLAEVSESQMPEGTMMVFSGEPGREVPDGAGDHSPFTEALLAEIDTQPHAVMTKLFSGVSQRIESDQKPWIKFDGAGQSFAAFTQHPLLPGSNEENESGADSASPPSSQGEAMRAELEKLRLEKERAEAQMKIEELQREKEKAESESSAKMAAEIAALREQLAALEAKKDQPQSPPEMPSRNIRPSSQWVIACEAEESERLARQKANRWQSRGFSAGVLWIPDYSSLSGAKLWLTYVGPWDYSDKSAVKSTLSRVTPYFRNAYGIKIDQSGKRETIAP